MRRYRTGVTVPLTEQESEVLAFITEFIGLVGYPPTIREIMSELGLASTFTTRARLVALERKGRIKRQTYKARSIQLIGATS